MPRVESELRSRDLEQMIAEPTITEEPIPIGAGVALSRFLTQSDILDLSDEFSSVSSTSRYYAVPLNLVINGDFKDDLNEWTVNEASAHTVDISEDTSQVDTLRQSIHSVKLELTGSTGGGVSSIYQDVDIEPNVSFSAEVWVLVTALEGSAACRMRVQFRNANGNVLSTQAVTFDDERDEFSLLTLPGGLAPNNAVEARFRLDARSLSSNDTITAYFMNAKASLVGSLLEWNERARAGFHAAS